MSWIKTDDMQYINKVKNGVYKIVEAKYVTDNRYVIYRGRIRISDWLNFKGNYDAKCMDIIRLYYESADQFEKAYPDEDFREQVLAEMIFETKFTNFPEYIIGTKQKVEEKLKEYMEKEKNTEMWTVSKESEEKTIEMELLQSLLSTIDYNDLTKEQYELITKYETKNWKAKIDEYMSKTNCTITEINEKIHELWLNYEISDTTEDNLFEYVSKKEKKYYIAFDNIRYVFPKEEPSFYEGDSGVLSSYVNKCYSRKEMDKIICDLIMKHPYIEGAMTLEIPVMWKNDTEKGCYHFLNFQNDKCEMQDREKFISIKFEL